MPDSWCAPHQGAAADRPSRGAIGPGSLTTIIATRDAPRTRGVSGGGGNRARVRPGRVVYVGLGGRFPAPELLVWRGDAGDVGPTRSLGVEGGSWPTVTPAVAPRIATKGDPIRIAKGPTRCCDPDRISMENSRAGRPARSLAITRGCLSILASGVSTVPGQVQRHLLPLADTSTLESPHRRSPLFRPTSDVLSASMSSCICGGRVQ